MKDVAIRKKIMEATIESIELYGIEGCTIRNIAKEAGVTLSSVHYYFESKEELVDAALNQAISGSFEDVAQMWQADEDKKRALTAILSFLFEGAVRYPGITRAGLHTLLLQGETEGLFVVSLNAFLSIAAQVLVDQYGLEQEAVAYRLMQAFSSVLYLGIAPDAYKAFSSVGFAEEPKRQAMIDSLITDIFRA